MRPKNSLRSIPLARERGINYIARMPRLPPWIRTNLRTDRGYARVDKLLSDLDLNTVCSSARCPNRQECWNRATATIMIMGSRCTRDCAFCAVETGIPQPLESGEPQRVAQAARTLNLKHVVLTSVTRDDLPDGGAGHFAQTIQAVKRECPGALVEVLTPDFLGKEDSITRVLESGPDIFNHNLETVRRLQAGIRPQADYERSLHVLRTAAAWGPSVRVKSGLMLGLGEREDELREALSDLRSAGCSLLTLGQYLAPTRSHHPVARFVTPGEFDAYRAMAESMGFQGVASGALVRSSYKAEELAEAACAPTE
ncbi:MAG: lipoyl synthase [Lentisphaerota bacterium]